LPVTRAADCRLRPRPTGGEESNGLGLAIGKHLVESQHGSVGADFPATGGSVFWFELPVA
jgi:K+-sensing histidine kinase KdpD